MDRKKLKLEECERDLKFELKKNEKRESCS